MAVLLFDLDAGLAGALGGLLVLAPFFVFRYFKVMNDMMSFCKMCTRVSGKVQCVEIGYESSLRFMGVVRLCLNPKMSCVAQSFVSHLASGVSCGKKPTCGPLLPQFVPCHTLVFTHRIA